jgi:hypothetical protein
VKEPVSEKGAMGGGSGFDAGQILHAFHHALDKTLGL